MPESLARLACAASAAALRFDAPAAGGGWRHDVSRACAVLASRSRGAVVLYHPDPYVFSVWLFAAWHDGRCVHLPADPGDATRAARTDALVLGAIPHADLEAWPVDGGHAELQPLAPSMAAVRVFTSGSTGAPQAIAKSLRQLDAEVQLLEQAFGAQLGTDARIASSVSHQHMYGLPFALLWPLASGRVLRRTPVRAPAELAALSPQSVLIGSPAFLRRLGPATASLRAVFCAGGVLPAEAAHAVATQLNATLIEIYGSSETGAVAWRSAVEEPWRALPEVRLRVRDDGQLEVRSPLLADEDWFTSADRAEAHGDSFRLLGRSDRIVKVEDKRVSLDALEQHLRAHDAVHELRVVLLPEQRDTLGAALVLSDTGRARYRQHGRAALVAALRTALAPHIDAVALPRRWRFVDALPADALGKVRQAAVTALFQQRPLLPLLLDCRSDPEGVHLVMEIAPELAVFDGHFPQAAIVPGVALLHWVMHHGQRRFALAGRFTGLRALKFHRVVRPRSELTLSLRWLQERGALEFSYDSAAGRHASGRVLIGDSAS